MPGTTKNFRAASFSRNLESGKISSFGQRTKRKRFFFEKKKQKTFIF
jgi:hypothetical protein